MFQFISQSRSSKKSRSDQEELPHQPSTLAISLLEELSKEEQQTLKVSDTESTNSNLLNKVTHRAEVSSLLASEARSPDAVDPSTSEVILVKSVDIITQPDLNTDH